MFILYRFALHADKELSSLRKQTTFLDASAIFPLNNV